MKIGEIKLTKKQAKIVIIESNVNLCTIRYLVLLSHRFEKRYHTILLDDKSYNLIELLEIIYNFYNGKTLTYLELKSLDSNDVYE